MNWNEKAYEYREFSLGRAELLAIFAFWTFMALLSVANQLLDPRMGPLQPVLPAAGVALAFSQAYTWALLTPLIFWMSTRAVVAHTSVAAKVATLIVAGLVLAAASNVFFFALRFHVFFTPRADHRPPPGPFTGLVRLWFLGEFTFFIAILAVGFAREYFLRYQNRRAEAARLEAQLAEAQLNALRSQLNPHFLFNTLNAVSALVERDPRGVRRMIARLSDLLRQSLEGARTNEVTLDDELKFVESYLEIMQVRFPDNFEVSIHIAPELRAAVVPHLVLQPLVENAVRHGGIEAAGEGCIEIGAERTGNELILRVRDYGPGPNGSTSKGAGTGLANTRARLAAMYGSKQKLELKAAEGGGTVAEVRLPYVTRTDR